MQTKTKAIAVLSVVLFAAVAGTLIFALQTPVKADNTTPIASDVSTPSPSAVTGDSTAVNNTVPWVMEPRFMRGLMGQGFGYSPGAVSISQDYITNITNIAKNDSDVANLISQGYNITSVRPVISTSSDGNGNVVTKASTADVVLQGTNGRALVVVDLDQAKVTKITTFTVTTITK